VARSLCQQADSRVRLRNRGPSGRLRADLQRNQELEPVIETVAHEWIAGLRSGPER
jgi:hypothetical protein